jgi:hypothetical protein
LQDKSRIVWIKAITWYEQIDTWLTGQGLIRSEADSNMYHCTQNGKTTVILLYVDDLLITGNDESEILRL